MRLGQLVTGDNIKALSPALLFFVYAVLALSTAQMHYLETLHRATVQRIIQKVLDGHIVDTLDDGHRYANFLVIVASHIV